MPIDCAMVLRDAPLAFISQIREYVMAFKLVGRSARRINTILLVLKMIQKAAGYPLVGVKKLREEKAEIDPFEPHEVDPFLAACPSW